MENTTHASGSKKQGLLSSIWRYFMWASSEHQKNMKKLNQMMQKKCPKCDGTELKKIKPGLGTWMGDAFRAPFSKPTKALNVCRSCGFSWDDR